MVYAKARCIQLHGPCGLSLEWLHQCVSVCELSAIFYPEIDSYESRIEAGIQFIRTYISLRRDVPVNTFLFTKIN